MIRSMLRTAMFVITTTVAATGWSSFQVADLVYVPIVSAEAGANDSAWRSDVMIYNADLAQFGGLPTGLSSNSLRFRDRQTWLGGREDDGFGIIEENLADIPPGATVVLDDVVTAYWPEDGDLYGNGSLVVFAYEADTLEDDGTRVFRNAIVSSRTYNLTSIFEPDPDNEGEFVEIDATYGQTIPGVPWYNLAYAEEFTDDRDLSSLVLLGGVEDGDFRYNLGLMNASDEQTQVTILLQPFQADGSPFLDESENEVIALVTLPPLAHQQYFRVLVSVFGLDPAEQDLSNITIRVSWVGWQTTGVSPVPAIAAYGSIVDDVSNDPTTVLPSFGEPYPLDCVWVTEPEATGGAKASGWRAGRAVEIPPR